MKIASHNATIANFQQFIGAHSFPCVGAKSAMAHDQITYFLAKDIRSPECDEAITAKLQEFALSCTPESLFVSCVVIFQHTSPLSERVFERFLWERLQAIHESDEKDYAWDQSISSDPESAHFSMSIAGKGFYIVGLHPDASRPARQFATAALVFNLHSQFDLLRDKGNYAHIRDTILTRDAKLSGSQNPMLAEHGQSSEAKQYSGRAVENEWKCPFHTITRNES